MHKPAQVELQLDRPLLPYSETLGPIIAGGSPTHYRRRQPNPTRKGPHNHFTQLTLAKEEKTSKDSPLQNLGSKTNCHINKYEEAEVTLTQINRNQTLMGRQRINLYE